MQPFRYKRNFFEKRKGKRIARVLKKKKKNCPENLTYKLKKRNHLNKNVFCFFFFLSFLKRKGKRKFWEGRALCLGRIVFFIRGIPPIKWDFFLAQLCENKRGVFCKKNAKGLKKKNLTKFLKRGFKTVFFWAKT